MSSKLGSFSRKLVFALAATVTLTLTGAPDVHAAPGFAAGYRAIPSTFKAQPQWQRVLASVTTQATRLPWQNLIDEYGDQHPLRQLDAVNRYFNRIPYAEDRDNYRTGDYWATPAEFISRRAGDCEDYAIAKYSALRAMGWSDDVLRIVAITDHKYKVNHAVLAAKFEGQWWYLDNRFARLTRPSEVPFYQPVYAVNGKGLSVFIKSRPTLEANSGNRSAAIKTGGAG